MHGVSSIILNVSISFITIGGIIGTFGAFYVDSAISTHETRPHIGAVTNSDLHNVETKVTTLQTSIDSRSELSAIIQKSNEEEHGRILKQQEKMIVILEELRQRRR